MNSISGCSIKVRQAHRAFTLLELLVVIGIIVVLAGLILPQLTLARDRAQGAVCHSNVRQLMLGWTMYPDDHDQWLSPTAVGGAGI